MRKIERLLGIDLPPGRAAFLWGPRKVGKSFWIRENFDPNEIQLIDLLKTDIFSDYASRPALLRERFQSKKIVIDEIQKVPALLDEVQWLLENKKASILLTGSSARKLRRGHANLLGGRAWRYELGPFSVREIGFDLDLEKAFVSGFLPPHFLSPEPKQDLRAYVADYLKEEIAAEAIVKNLPEFSSFLEASALTSSELLNYTNLGRETGVSAKVARSYFQILEDTLLGLRLSPWKKSRTRRMIQTEKFYYFDVGLANYLCRRTPALGTFEFGKSFEHFIFMELLAYQRHRSPDLPIHYWRSSTGLEVDFILGEMDLALEVKGKKKVHDGDLRHLRTLMREEKLKHAVVVCLEAEPRTLADGIEVLPWTHFIDRLWDRVFVD